MGEPPAGSGRRPWGATQPPWLGWVQRALADPPPERQGRWGIVWFLVVLGAWFLGSGAVAVLFAVVAGVGALQTAAVWGEGRQPIQLLAALCAAALPLAAAAGPGPAGLVSLLCPVAAVAGAGWYRHRRHRTAEVLALAGVVLRCGWPLGVAAASAVLVTDSDPTALLVLVVLISAYEVGDYVVGTEASTPLAGPVAGIAAVVVLTFGWSVLELGPVDAPAAWVFGGLVASLAPLGTVAGTALMPPTTAPGPAVRRLDSWLLVGPVWSWVLWGYLG